MEVCGHGLGAKLPHHERDLTAVVSGMVQLYERISASKVSGNLNPVAQPCLERSARKARFRQRRAFKIYCGFGRFEYFS